MSANIAVYIAPEGVDSPQDAATYDWESFDWEGPDIFHFKSGFVTSLMTGYSGAGAALHEALMPPERALLEARGSIQEERLPLLDPVELRATLMKAYEAYAQQIFAKPVEAQDLSWFDKAKRDIAGAIMICDRAIEKRRRVFWALW